MLAPTAIATPTAEVLATPVAASTAGAADAASTCSALLPDAEDVQWLASDLQQCRKLVIVHAAARHCERRHVALAGQL